jgi:hypothetical protein
MYHVSVGGPLSSPQADNSEAERMIVAAVAMRRRRSLPLVRGRAFACTLIPSASNVGPSGLE